MQAKDKSAKEYFGCKLKYSDIEYKVEGLEEIAAFNPFEYVEVEFEGAVPYGKANVKADTDKKEMQYIEFSIDKQYDLSNGDKIIVTHGIHLNAVYENDNQSIGLLGIEYLNYENQFMTTLK